MSTTRKPYQRKLSEADAAVQAAFKQIAPELVRAYDRILENTDEFQDLDDKQRKQVERQLIDLLSYNIKSRR